MDNDRKYFLPYQYDWITDPRPLKMAEKARQIGITFADAYHSVRIASNKGARYDVFVSSRDKFQAKLYIEDCKNWGQVTASAAGNSRPSPLSRPSATSSPHSPGIPSASPPELP